jgi:hypothetical protein
MAAVDKSLGGEGEPAANAEAISPSDSSELSTVSRALYVGGAGNISVVMLGGQAITLTAVPVGAILPIRVKQVKSTGTTATFLICLY